NNQTAVAFQVTGGNGGTPDLVVSAFTAPGSGAPGATLSVTDTTKNQGTGDVTVSTWTRLYLSTTPYWTTASVYLASRSVGPLTAGGTRTGAAGVPAPGGTGAGGHLPPGVGGRPGGGDREQKGKNPRREPNPDRPVPRSGANPPREPGLGSAGLRSRRASTA